MCIQSGLVRFSTSWSLVKEILCVFLGYVCVRVYAYVEHVQNAQESCAGV